MTRLARVVTISAAAIAGLMPGCTHTSAMSIKPSGSKNPPAVADAAVAQASQCPAEAGSGEEAQAAPPEKLANPAAVHSPFATISLLPTSPSEGYADEQRNPPGADFLSPRPASLLTPVTASDAAPGVRSPALPPGDKKDQPIVLAVRSFLNDNPKEALEYLKSYDAATQEALICLTATVVLLTKKNLDQLSPKEIDELQDQVQKSLAALRPHVPLQIDKMCFCEEIKGYGVYKPLPRDYAFQPMTVDRYGELVQLYVELHNLTSELHGTTFVTRLHSTMRIFDEAGKEVYFADFRAREAPLCTLTRLPDTFKHYDFYVPRLPPGKYRFCFEVRDVTRPQARIAKKSLEFRVAAVGSP
jgi:hypothetical protein